MPKQAFYLDTNVISHLANPERTDQEVWRRLSLLDLAARKTTEQAEVFTTIYAAWNDPLLAAAKPTDADLASEFRDNWHDSKQRLTADRIQTCMDRIREQNLTRARTETCTKADSQPNGVCGSRD